MQSNVMSPGALGAESLIDRVVRMCRPDVSQVNLGPVLLSLLLCLGSACSLVPSTGRIPSSVSGASPARAGVPASAVPVEQDDVVVGDSDALVTLVAFLDFECPYCSGIHPTLTSLQARHDSAQLRLVIKHNPLPFHSRGLPAAIAVQAVSQLVGPATAFSYAGALLKHAGDLSDTRLERTAVEHGVALEAFRRAVLDERMRGQVESDMDLGLQLGVKGTPAFFLNGAPLTGARPLEAFERMIAHELRAAEALLGTGLKKGDVYQARVGANLRAPDVIDPSNDRMRWVVPVEGAVGAGPTDAPVTIVEFSDFECPFCTRAHSVMKEIRRRYPDDVRWIVRHNPLAFHPQATPAAILALETLRQRGKDQYILMLSRLFAGAALGPSMFSDLASEFGLSASELESAFAQGSAYPALVRDQDLALDLKADGTPHFFVNGRRIAGAEPVERFEELIAEELTVAADLRAAGVPRAEIYSTLMAKAFGPPGLERLSNAAPPQDAPSQGPDDAPVVVQMFSDFECAYCGRVMRTLGQLRSRYPDEVRVVFRHLPLGFHRNARLAAAAAVEAQVQKGNDGFWLMANLMFAEKERELSAVELGEMGAKAGLDAEQLRSALADGRHEPSIRRDEREAMDLGISGTPSFIVGGYQLRGAQPLHRFERLVRKAMEDRTGSPAGSGGDRPAP